MRTIILTLPLLHHVSTDDKWFWVFFKKSVCFFFLHISDEQLCLCLVSKQLPGWVWVCLYVCPGGRVDGAGTERSGSSSENKGHTTGRTAPSEPPCWQRERIISERLVVSFDTNHREEEEGGCAVRSATSCHRGRGKQALILACAASPPWTGSSFSFFFFSFDLSSFWMFRCPVRSPLDAVLSVRLLRRIHCWGRWQLCLHAL